MASSERRVEANRRNAKKSTGPRSEAGKERSRGNAVKHGMRSEVVRPEDEDRERMAAEVEAWEGHYGPESPAEWALVRRGALASVRLTRCGRGEAAKLEERRRHAVARWHMERKREVETLVNRLAVEPCRVARELRETPEGCSWLMARWRLLKLALEGRGFWTLEEFSRALHLLGRSEEGRRRELSGCRLTAANLAANSGRSAEAAATDGVLSAEQGRAWLGRKIRREMARLRERRVALRADRSRDLALVADAALFDESPGAALMRRYESAAMTDLGRCVTLLARLRKERESSTTPGTRRRADSAGAPNEAIAPPGPEVVNGPRISAKTAEIVGVPEIETPRKTAAVAVAEAPNEPKADPVEPGPIAGDRPSRVRSSPISLPRSSEGGSRWVPRSAEQGPGRTPSNSPLERGRVLLDTPDRKTRDRGGRAMRSRQTVIIMIALSIATAASGGDPPSSKKKPTAPPDLNRKVVEFARSKLGESVDNGECTRLASAALRASGGRLPKFRGDEDYVWGDLVATYTTKDRPVVEILPGDILQFRDARVVTTSKSKGMTRIQTRTYPHHTAIVASASGRSLRILHQNVGTAEMTDAEKKIVKEEALPLLDLKAGTIWVYRPVADVEG